MKGKIRLKGQLKLYMQWPMILMLLLIAMNVVLYGVNLRAGAIATGFLGVYAAIVVLLYFQNRSMILNELISFATQYGQVQKNLLRDFIFPYVLDRKSVV